MNRPPFRALEPPDRPDAADDRPHRIRAWPRDLADDRGDG